MKICHKCEAINADGAQFCCKCGAQLGASQHGSLRGGSQQPQGGTQSGISQHGSQRDGYQQSQGGTQPGISQYGSQRGGYQQSQGGTQQFQYQGYNPQGGYRQQGYQPQPARGASMGFGNAINVCLKQKYASFEGRATRAEYWYFVLFAGLITFVAAIVGGILGGVFSGGDGDAAVGFAIVLYGIVSLGLLCPLISVLVRRLHDTGRSGWWYWIALIPYIGSIVVFVFTLLGSQQRDNEYGPYLVYC